MNVNYELVMKDLIYHLFLPKVLQHQKRYLWRGVIQTSRHENRGFRMMDWQDGRIENFPPFGYGQRLPYNNILDLVEFSLPNKWQKQLIT